VTGCRPGARHRSDVRLLAVRPVAGCHSHAGAHYLGQGAGPATCHSRPSPHRTAKLYSFVTAQRRFLSRKVIAALGMGGTVAKSLLRSRNRRLYLRLRSYIAAVLAIITCWWASLRQASHSTAVPSSSQGLCRHRVGLLQSSLLSCQTWAALPVAARHAMACLLSYPVRVDRAVCPQHKLRDGAAEAAAVGRVPCG